MIKSLIINLGPFFSKLKVVIPASIEEHLNVLILGSSCTVYCLLIVGEFLHLRSSRFQLVIG